MAIEKTQLKFAKSKLTGEPIGFVSYNVKTHKLKGVCEDSIYGKKICLLCRELKDTVVIDKLYDVELKAMHKANGYVVISARPMLFNAVVETIIITRTVYQITISFGNKVIYFDPIDGKSPSSCTRKGVVKTIMNREDIGNRKEVIKEFTKNATILLKRMEKDGYLLSIKC